jgi:hypothetical protein
MPAQTMAQSADQVATVPPNIVLNNYDSVPVGPFGGLEGSAYVARVSDPSASWFNPAGLSRQAAAQISGSAGAFQWTSVSPDALPDKGGSLQMLPNYIGFTVRAGGRLTAGAALLTTTSWIQNTDSELIVPSAAGGERLAFSADSKFVRRIAAVGAGFEGTGGWRAGGGLALSLVDLRLTQGISQRMVDAASIRTLFVAARVSGSAAQLRGQFGVQYDTPRLRLGGAIRTPALTLHRSGTLMLDGTLDTGPASVGASAFDANARFQSPAPWELQAGIAFVRDRVEIEADLHGYTPVAAHPLLSTAAPIVIYADAGDSTPPAVILRPFDGLTSASNGVVNVAVGGHVRPIRGRLFRVHGGFATNRSPVGDADEVFNAVHLASWTIGASGTVAKLQFSVGFNGRVGTGRDVIVRNTLSGEPVQANVKVDTRGFIYSIAYQF